jgi:hypothetical protein
MSDYHYPDLTDHATWAVKTILTLASEDVLYLRSPDCPYDAQFKNIIDRAIAFGNGSREEKEESTEKPPVSAPVSEDEIDSTLAGDLHSVFTELKAYGKTIGQSDQTERMAYFRTATSLLERLVNARERALGVKQIKDFQDTVLTIMEEVLSPDQRTDVMDRLRSVLARSAAADDGATDPTTEETV